MGLSVDNCLPSSAFPNPIPESFYQNEHPHFYNLFCFSSSHSSCFFFFYMFISILYSSCQTYCTLLPLTDRPSLVCPQQWLTEDKIKRDNIGRPPAVSFCRIDCIPSCSNPNLMSLDFLPAHPCSGSADKSVRWRNLQPPDKHSSLLPQQQTSNNRLNNDRT